MVVPGTEQDAVVEVRAPAIGPRCPPVMGLAPGGGDGATFGAALAIADDHRLALCGSEQSGGAAQVEDLRLLAEHGRDDPTGAREAACVSGGELVGGAELGD